TRAGGPAPGPGAACTAPQPAVAGGNVSSTTPVVCIRRVVQWPSPAEFGDTGSARGSPQRDHINDKHPETTKRSKHGSERRRNPGGSGRDRERRDRRGNLRGAEAEVLHR